MVADMIAKIEADFDLVTAPEAECGASCQMRLSRRSPRKRSGVVPRVFGITHFMGFAVAVCEVARRGRRRFRQ
jgi:hypothetical protein